MHITPANYKERLAAFRQAAQQAGIKITPQRLEIFRQVVSSDTHPTADEIHRRIRKKLPTVTLDTVYRTLWLLADLGLLNTVGLRDDSIRFDANLNDHHHFRCERCGAILDFTSAELSGLALPPELEEYGSTRSVHIEVRGICAKCLSKLPGRPGTDRSSTNKATKE
jgi:Fur family peroxide stress response transcriptional regulator